MQVARIFNEAAQISPEDADVHIVLGVLYNLSREYDKAIASFQTALKLKPQDYSLWNKLGATQANSVQSADAILAYQQVCLCTITSTTLVQYCLVLQKLCTSPIIGENVGCFKHRFMCFWITSDSMG